MKQDPVCLIEIDEAEAHSQGLSAEHAGRRYYFCSDQCKEDFERDPESYLIRENLDQSDELRPDDYA